MDGEFNLSHTLFINWKKIGLYTFSVALLVALIVSKLGTKKQRLEEDYVSAAGAFTKWEQSLGTNSDAFEKLDRLVKKHPELYAHYDSFIGQSLLATLCFKQAAPFIERTLERTKQPYYSDYARASLKISERRYQEALDEALILKDKMDMDDSFLEKPKNYSALFAFNLLRIATLREHLNHKESELKAWKEIRQHGGWDNTESSATLVGDEGFKKLLSHFSIQDITLLDYIKTREEALKAL